MAYKFFFLHLNRTERICKNRVTVRSRRIGAPILLYISYFRNPADRTIYLLGRVPIRADKVHELHLSSFKHLSNNKHLSNMK